LSHVDSDSCCNSCCCSCCTATVVAVTDHAANVRCSVAENGAALNVSAVQANAAVARRSSDVAAGLRDSSRYGVADPAANDAANPGCGFRRYRARHDCDRWIVVVGAIDPVGLDCAADSDHANVRLAGFDHYVAVVHGAAALIVAALHDVADQFAGRFHVAAVPISAGSRCAIARLAVELRDAVDLALDFDAPGANAVPALVTAFAVPGAADLSAAGVPDSDDPVPDVAVPSAAVAAVVAAVAAVEVAGQSDALHGESGVLVVVVRAEPDFPDYALLHDRVGPERSRRWLRSEASR